MGSFHAFSHELINYVTSEKFEEWLALDYEKTDGCPYFGQNIYAFIQYFDIPREEFERLYYGTEMYYNCDYNVELLYSGDEAAIYAYYERGGSYDEMLYRFAVYNVKIDLNNLPTKSKNQWRQVKGTGYMTWSIPEYVYEFGVPEQALREIVEKYNDSQAMCLKGRCSLHRL